MHQYLKIKSVWGCWCRGGGCYPSSVPLITSVKRLYHWKVSVNSNYSHIWRQTSLQSYVKYDKMKSQLSYYYQCCIILRLSSYVEMVFQYVSYTTSKKIYIHLPFPQLWQKFVSNCILVPHFIQNIFNVFNNSLIAKQKKTYFIKFNFIFIINLF